MKIIKSIIPVIGICSLAFGLKPTKLFNDAAMTGALTLDRDTVYILTGAVYVDPGELLTIESGTMIKAALGTAANVSALIVTNGGQINAQGTVDAPIVFTTIVDDENAPALGPDNRGLWGGVVLLGDAPISEGSDWVEGLPVSARTSYGGINPTHSAGIFRYVSIRHGGSELAPGNELNGVTFGGVGSGTTFDHVEVYANADDGFEFFGGTINTKYLVSAYNDDDGFDWDNGFRGKGQFWFVVQGNKNGNSGLELDGNQDPLDVDNYSKPTISNVTIIGSGNPSDNAANSSQPTIMMRDGTGGFIHNSIFTSFRNKAVEVEIEFIYTNDSWDNLKRDSLAIKNNIFFDYGAGNTFQTISSRVELGDSLAPYNTIINPLLRGIGREKNADLLDPRPSAASPAFTLPRKAMTDPFFSVANYMGAFSASDLWIDKWTTVAKANISKQYLTLSAASGKYYKTSATDLIFYKWSAGSLNLALTKVYLDGANVSSNAAIISMLSTPLPLVGGGNYYKLSNVNLSALGGVGKHTLKVQFVLTNGESYENSVTYELVQ